MRFAILDLETTGGSPKMERITEVAIILVENGQVLEEFESLVNPERSIPPMITRITGITDDMVQEAPRFYEIAKRVVEMTEGATIVAHNARFDYGFLQNEFKQLGFSYSRKRLCTVQLCKKLLPELRKHNLDAMIKHFGIVIDKRHRAMDDTRATWELFQNLQEMDHGFGREKDLINFGVRSSRLPQSITIDFLHTLPEETGVYFFQDSDAQVIYVGKSINIKKRIFQHFQKLTRKSEQMQYLTTDISYELTGSELISLLYESELIKSLNPQLNKAQRKNKYPYAIVVDKEDEYIKFKILKTQLAFDRNHRVLDTFSSQKSARGRLGYLFREFQLCPILCSLEKETEDACKAHYLGYCQGACIHKEPHFQYNLRANLAIELADNVFDGDFIILSEGRSEDEQSVVLVKDGYYAGYGYVDKSDSLSQDDILNHIDKKKGNAETNRIIRQYMTKSAHKIQLIDLPDHEGDGF